MREMSQKKIAAAIIRMPAAVKCQQQDVDVFTQNNYYICEYKIK